LQRFSGSDAEDPKGKSVAEVNGWSLQETFDRLLAHQDLNPQNMPTTITMSGVELRSEDPG